MIRHRKLAAIGLVAGMAISGLASRAGAQTTYLYQGSGTQTPQSQGWLYELAPGVTPVSNAGTTTFDSTSSASLQGGYSNDTPLGSPLNTSFPSLNPTTGFSVSLDGEINSETHNTQRTGFDWIVLGSDGKGVELGFEASDIFAYNYSSSNNPVFYPSTTEDVDAENTPTFDGTFSTEGAINDYVLSIQGTSYSLTDDGTTILTGQTHDYSGEGIEPYTLDNYIFIGDDTSEVGASETFSSLAVTVPEPASGTALLAIAAPVMMRRKRK
jgi:hypothetical protein